MSESPKDLPALAIYLGSIHVGDIHRAANEGVEFRPSEEYRERPRRPVLGQIFEDDLSAVHRARMQLPPFFSNLLPEGRLRELVAARLDVAAVREFFLLAHLGEDLPGNVRAVATGPLLDEGLPSSTGAQAADSAPLKFSLAGVQPKLSMLREGRGMTFPASGLGGDWIVKLPGTRFQGVPENEYATMSWAGLVGIEIPQVELVKVSDLSGLPAGLMSDEGGMAFAIRRFDRPSPGQRIHIEDFAQVRNVYPDARSKYRSMNYETLGKIILRTAGRASFDEFIRRLAFVVVSANADAHIKNWSLIYPDGIRAQLSPAYDLVSTVEFIEEDALALNLAKTKAWREISLERFGELAGRIGVDRAPVMSLVRDVVQRSLDAWTAVRRKYPVSPLWVERLEAHWRKLPLVRDLKSGERTSPKA